MSVPPILTLTGRPVGTDGPERRPDTAAVGHVDRIEDPDGANTVRALAEKAGREALGGVPRVGDDGRGVVNCPVSW